jgi:hypothetical protein
VAANKGAVNKPVLWRACHACDTGDMALNMIKLAVGVDDLAHMKKVQAARRNQRHQKPGSPHWVFTRNTPKRAEELLAGGSLYWVIRGVIRCRQELVGFDEDFDKEEARKYCKIKVKRTIVSTAPRACRAFQGWRYFEGDRVPPDLSKGDTSDMPLEMAAELKRLGLL